MKIASHLNRLGDWRGLTLAGLTALCLGATAPQVRAYTNSFDNAASINGWAHWYGGAVETCTFDPNLDYSGNPLSGSLKVTVPFSRSLGGDNQFSMWGSFSGTPGTWDQPLNGAQYLRLEMDLLWSPSSPLIPSSGNYSTDFHYGFAVGAPVYGQISFDNHLVITPAEAGDWIHLSADLDAEALGPNLTNIVGIWIKMWTGDDPENSLEDGTATFWVDNIRLTAKPPPPDWVQGFDSAAGLSAWAHWWGGATETRTFDPAMDSKSDPNSGSMKVTVPYSRSLGGDNQFSMWGAFSGTAGTWNQPLNGLVFTNIEMDIYWDPSSPTRPSTGDYGGDFRYGFAVGAPAYAQISFNNHPVIAAGEAGEWIHLSSPIDPAAAGDNLTNIVGIWIKMWTGDDPQNSLNDGTATFWVDNIRLAAKATNAPPEPAPTLSIDRPGAPGLRLFASAPGVVWQRQGIRTRNPAYSWVGAANPVTYSLTISGHPGDTSFQTHLFLIPGTVAATVTDADYAQPNCIMLDIERNADGTAFGAFRFKTNEPAGNAFLYSAGSIATVGSAGILGTWNLTFNPGGEISLTSPSGGLTNFTLPPDALTFFANPVYAYFGIQPNQASSVGLAGTLGLVQITGLEAVAPINDNFSAPTLDLTTWEVVAQDPRGVIPVPPDALFWLTWTLPDIGFGLETASTVTPAQWDPLALTGAQVGTIKRVLVLPASLPASPTGNYFIRLNKP